MLTNGVGWVLFGFGFGQFGWDGKGEVFYLMFPITVWKGVFVYAPN